jgi:F0F1-type ATP synthase membrane subunit b/b'
MELEDILKIMEPRPSFWIRVWLFFFLLFNRKEGKRLMETLIAKIDKAVEEVDEMKRRLAAYSDDVEKKLQESEELLHESFARRIPGYKAPH